MQRLKSLWDKGFMEFRHLNSQSLWDNARQFNKDKTVSNALLVKQPETHIQNESTEEVQSSDKIAQILTIEEEAGEAIDLQVEPYEEDQHLK